MGNIHPKYWENFQKILIYRLDNFYSAPEWIHESRIGRIQPRENCSLSSRASPEPARTCRVWSVSLIVYHVFGTYRPYTAPCVPADADDTAKALLTLNLLKKQTSPESMINHFRSKYKHFLTYPGERDASFSANCNVLKALLESPDVNCYKAEVSSIASFLCDSWWSGAVKDKWVCHQYSSRCEGNAYLW